MSVSVTQPGPEPDREAGAGVDDEPDAGVLGVTGNLVGQRTPVAGSVAQRHVDMGGGGDAEADAGVEQFADVDDVLGGFLDVAGHPVVCRAALGQHLGQQPQRVTDAGAVAVSGEHGQLVDHQQLVRRLGADLAAPHLGLTHPCLALEHESRNSVSRSMASSRVVAQRWNRAWPRSVSVPPLRSIIQTRSRPSRIIGPAARSGFHNSEDLPAPDAPTTSSRLPRRLSRNGPPYSLSPTSSR